MSGRHTFIYMVQHALHPLDRRILNMKNADDLDVSTALFQASVQLVKEVGNEGKFVYQVDQDTLTASVWELCTVVSKGYIYNNTYTQKKLAYTITAIPTNKSAESYVSIPIRRNVSVTDRQRELLLAELVEKLKEDNFGLKKHQ